MTCELVTAIPKNAIRLFSNLDAKYLMVLHSQYHVYEEVKYITQLETASWNINSSTYTSSSYVVFYQGNSSIRKKF